MERKISSLGENLQQLDSLSVTFEEAGDHKLNLMADCEAIFVILEGNMKINFNEQVFKMSRTDVFEGLPQALFFEASKKADSFSLEALSPNSRGVLAQAKVFDSPNSTKRKTTFIDTDGIETFDRGEGQFKRHIRNIATDNINAKSIICGETINPPGNWSSFPPHKHDTKIEGEESVHEEVYVFSTNPKNGWGYQELYTDDRSLSEVYRVENNDAIVIPYGYHPVSAAPGYKLHYLWVLAGAQRELIMNDDPVHKWIKDNTAPS